MSERSGKLFKDNEPQWYLAIGENWLGPLKASEVYDRISKNEITWAHYIMREQDRDSKMICEWEDFEHVAPSRPKKNLPKTKSKNKLDPRPQVIRSKRLPEKDANWFVFQQGNQLGPYSFQELVRLIDIDSISGHSHIWRPGWDNWRRLQKVPDLSGFVKDKKTEIKEVPADARKTPRMPIVAEIRYTDEKDVTIGLCRDISEGGMQVLTDPHDDLKIGDSIRLNVSPSSTSSRQLRPFVAVGEVVRILEDGHGFSFRFTEISDADKLIIRNLVESDS